MPLRPRLKHSSGWFAAGREVESALRILPAPAFKLFIWICLRADRCCGLLLASPEELACATGETIDEIHAELSILENRGVCAHTLESTIKITDAFWPYERVGAPATTDEKPELTGYIRHVKRLLLERRCVQTTFAAADVALATDLYGQGISTAEVEHAIYLGALRKYATLLNNGAGSPITSLRYFISLFDEVRQETSPQYWAYIEQKVHSWELRWRSFADIVKPPV